MRNTSFIIMIKRYTHSGMELIRIPLSEVDLYDLKLRKIIENFLIPSLSDIVMEYYPDIEEIRYPQGQSEPDYRYKMITKGPYMFRNIRYVAGVQEERVLFKDGKLIGSR